MNANAQPLAIDPELSGIARKRAADMAAKNYFAHAAPNGDTSASLLMDTGRALSGPARREHGGGALRQQSSASTWIRSRSAIVDIG